MSDMAKSIVLTSDTGSLLVLYPQADSCFHIPEGHWVSFEIRGYES